MFCSERKEEILRKERGCANQGTLSEITKEEYWEVRGGGGG